MLFSRSPITVVTVVTLCLATLSPPAAAAETGWDARWDALLRDHVTTGTIRGVRLALVPYARIRADPRWAEVVQGLALAPEPADPAARKAYWINAYNVLCVKVVLGHYPLKGIKEAGTLLRPVWKEDAGLAAGTMRTLDEVEHKILRPMGDARIHAAIVCASVSCPDLRAGAYRADQLDEQLDGQMRLFLANPAKGAVVEKDGGMLRVSPIFDWFREDFVRDAGSVQAYVRKYLPPDLARRLKEKAGLKNLDYDWGLNDAALAPDAR